MPPKKEKKEKKKKEVDPNAERDAIEEQLTVCQAELNALVKAVEIATLDRNRERAAAQELKSQLKLLKEAYTQTLEDRSDILQDLTRQYKQRQDELCDKINSLENQRIELVDRIDLRNIEQEQIKREFDEEISRQDRIIESHHEKMEKISREFEKMLRGTLDQLERRIRSEQETSHGADGARHFDTFQEVDAYARQKYDSIMANTG